MTLDQLFAEIAQRKLRVTNLYLDTGRAWRCSLRRNDREVSSLRGIGATPHDAIRDALDIRPAADPFEDLLG